MTITNKKSEPVKYNKNVHYHPDAKIEIKRKRGDSLLIYGCFLDEGNVKVLRLKENIHKGQWVLFR